MKTLMGQVAIPFLVIRRLIRLVVNLSINLNNQSFFKTAKVGDITINGLLASELEPHESAISKFPP